MKKLLDLISCFLFLLFAMIMAIIPFAVLYVISDGLAFLLRRIFRYRLDVIKENIGRSNLVVNGEQQEKLVRDIYKNISDVIIESIRSFSMSRRSVLKRHRVLNPGLVQPYFESGKSIILVTGHIGNWEWGSLSAGLQTPFKVIGFYKPLKNKFIDRFLRWSRSRFGTRLMPIRKTSLTFEQQHGIPSLFLMAADQNPTKVKLSHWVRFLGRETAFLHGPEKHAMNNDYPVVFADIKRVKRGYYELYLSLITDTPSQMSPGEITLLYAEKLEEAIHRATHSWLWTHKRWKHKRNTEKITE
ncbi:MAG: lysophospholipid acyltransferase family protein [Bacteroidota bacterium]